MAHAGVSHLAAAVQPSDDRSGQMALVRQRGQAHHLRRRYHALGQGRQRSPAHTAGGGARHRGVTGWLGAIVFTKQVGAASGATEGSEKGGGIPEKGPRENNDTNEWRPGDPAR